MDDTNHLCLTDFGLAHFTDAGQITMGISTWRSGAERWMPREVLLGAKCEKTSDVYSFGCVCLEVSVRCSCSLDLPKRVCSQIVTGRRPFPEFPKDAQVIGYVCGGNSPNWPTTVDPILSGLATVVRPCWHQDPNKRPSMERVNTTLSAAS